MKEEQVGLSPKRADVLNYLRGYVIDGQVSPEVYDEIAKSEQPTIGLLSKHLPESLLPRVNSLFFTTKYTKPVMVERRKLNDEDLGLIGSKLKEFFHAFRLPDHLLHEVLSSEFTIIKTKDEKPELVVPPQETPVEE